MPIKPWVALEKSSLDVKKLANFHIETIDVLLCKPGGFPKFYDVAGLSRDLVDEIISQYQDNHWEVRLTGKSFKGDDVVIRFDIPKNIEEIKKSVPISGG